MRPDSVCSAYFSATYTTRSIVRLIAGGIAPQSQEYDITMPFDGEVSVDGGSVFVVGVPVYAGRVPAAALRALERFRGNDTTAVAVAVYGNRDYDDALLELTQTLEGNGFRVVSAGAFIARHSIFPQVAGDRPDEQDKAAVREFAAKTAELLAGLDDVRSAPLLHVPGSFPYKVPGGIPLKPVGNRRCDGCGTCVRLCPAGAIPAAAPRTTDGERCIACGRCIVVCPQRARHFGGLLYRMASKKFIKANSGRKEPETFYIG